MIIKNGHEAAKVLRDLQKYAKDVGKYSESQFDEERDVSHYSLDMILKTLQELTFEDEVSANATLMTFAFETGDHEVPYYSVDIIIEGQYDYGTLEDAFAAYIEQSEDGEEYEEIVANVMGLSGLTWHFVNGSFTCGKVDEMRI